MLAKLLNQKACAFAAITGSSGRYGKCLHDGGAHAAQQILCLIFATWFCSLCEGSSRLRHPRPARDAPRYRLAGGSCEAQSSARSAMAIAIVIVVILVVVAAIFWRKPSE